MGVTARYAFYELVSVLAVVVLVLLLIALGGRFIGYLQDAAIGKYSTDVLLVLLGYRLPEFAQQIIPFALFLAVLLTFSRWYAESEMAVLVAAGVAPGRLLLWVLGFSLVLAAGVAYLSLAVSPRLALALDQAVIEQREDREFQALTPGVFHAFNRGQRVIYTEQLGSERRTLTNVFIGERRDDGTRTTIWANSGRQHEDPVTGSRFLVLQDGIRYEGIPGRGGYRVVEFKTMSQRVERRDIVRKQAKLKTVPTRTLQVSTNPEYEAELQWRLSLPLLTLVGAALGFAFARVKPRAGRFGRVLPALGIFVLYYLAILLGRQAVAEPTALAAFGLWPVHLGFVTLTAVLAWRAQQPAST